MTTACATLYVAYRAQNIKTFKVCMSATLRHAHITWVYADYAPFLVIPNKLM